jgi:hypothetical protein
MRIRSMSFENIMPAAMSILQGTYKTGSMMPSTGLDMRWPQEEVDVDELNKLDIYFDKQNTLTFLVSPDIGVAEKERLSLLLTSHSLTTHLAAGGLFRDWDDTIDFF